MTEPKSTRSLALGLDAALARLQAAPEKFVELFAHGTLSVEIYRPGDVDLQQPHDRDEIYVVASGRGTFLHGERRTPVGPGDLLFVPALLEHRFVDFTPDLAVWVLFYGPPGGEAP
jgi:mannose-6-phosphate isomerase-like protein (cupin superfamily)